MPKPISTTSGARRANAASASSVAAGERQHESRAERGEGARLARPMRPLRTTKLRGVRLSSVLAGSPLARPGRSARPQDVWGCSRKTVCFAALGERRVSGGPAADIRERGWHELRIGALVRRRGEAQSDKSPLLACRYTAILQRCVLRARSSIGASLEPERRGKHVQEKVFGHARIRRPSCGLLDEQHQQRRRSGRQACQPSTPTSPAR